MKRQAAATARLNPHLVIEVQRAWHGPMSIGPVIFGVLILIVGLALFSLGQLIALGVAAIGAGFIVSMSRIQCIILAQGERLIILDLRRKMLAELPLGQATIEPAKHSLHGLAGLRVQLPKDEPEPLGIGMWGVLRCPSAERPVLVRRPKRFQSILAGQTLDDY